MDPICPLLTLGGDPRVVAAVADPAHRCSATGALTLIDRDHQIRFCLGGAYESCDRYRRHLTEVGPVGAAWGPGAPDATYARTRLVVESAPRSVLPRPPARAWRVALVAALIILVGAAVGYVALGGVGGLFTGPSPSQSPLPTATPLGSGQASGLPAQSLSPTPLPTATPEPTPTPAPTPVTYIVQPGDTLNAIAARFGTTAQAIMTANGLTSDVINPGQVLIIPAS